MRGWAWIAALCLLLPPLLWRPPVRQQELRVLVTARNMAESGDWLRPEFQNQARFRKPPLAYWMAATAMRLGGQTHSTAIARLPFLLAALGVFALTRRFAAPHGDLAGGLLLATFGFWRYAGLAETDLPQLAGLCLAFWGWQGRRGSLAALGIALGILAKGPAALAVPWLSFLLLQAKDPRDRRFWAQTLLVPLAVGAAWLAWLGRDPAGTAALGKELRATFVDTAHPGNPFYYLYTAPKLLAPALLAPLLWKSRGTIPRLPGVWIAVTLVLLTLTPSKQDHYALLLLPPAAWALAACIGSIKTFPAWSAAAALAIGAGLAMADGLSEDAAHARFLRAARSHSTDAGTLHVVGINSAVFDFHLGRHVENTDSAASALRRAKAGDWVVVVQKARSWDAGESSPHPLLLEADDGVWLRRLYGVAKAVRE